MLGFGLKMLIQSFGFLKCWYKLFLHERKNERIVNKNLNEFFFEKNELELERIQILRDEFERELERQKNENV